MKFVKHIENSVEYYSVDTFSELGFQNMFTTKKGGVSFSDQQMNFGLACGDTQENVLDNFKIALKYVNSDCNKAIKAKQTHSDTVLYVNHESCGEGILVPQRFFEADGLITDEKDVSLVVFYADCVPVIMADKVTRTVCAVHSGWRGTMSNIIGNAINKMVNEKGSNVENIIAAVGPCIGMCHFEIDQNIYSEFQKKLGNEFIKKKDEKYYADLGRMVRKQIILSGVNDENVCFADLCTYCNEEFYSYRREKEKTGRMAAIIHS